MGENFGGHSRPYCSKYPSLLSSSVSKTDFSKLLFWFFRRIQCQKHFLYQKVQHTCSIKTTIIPILCFSRKNSLHIMVPHDKSRTPSHFIFPACHQINNLIPLRCLLESFPRKTRCTIRIEWIITICRFTRNYKIFVFFI